ncbi:ribonuclease H-like domain-containing protein [Tanacetum coccineum]
MFLMKHILLVISMKTQSEIEDLPVNTVKKSSRQTKLPTSLNDFIIAGKVKYDVERVVNYANLSHENLCFASILNKSVEPTCYNDVILDNNWIDAMNAKIKALNKNHTWIVTDLLTNRKPIGCKWIFKIKYKANGEIERYKARLVAKSFNQREGIVFDEIFSPIVFKLVKSLYGLKQAPRNQNNKFIVLLVYVDDIVVTDNCVNEINQFKTFLKSKFNIKNLGSLKYFLGIEVIKIEDDICLSQRKYYLELFKEYGLLGCKPVFTPMEPNYVLSYIATSDDPLLDNITGYQKLFGKLIYLTHTRHDISYSVHCLAQYMHSPLKSHLNSAFNVLKYLTNTPGKGIIKKQNTLSKSSTEAEYRSMSSYACEIIWIQKLLYDLNTKVTILVDLFCDNKSALQLAVNLVFHEHFEAENSGAFDQDVLASPVWALARIGTFMSRLSTQSNSLSIGRQMESQGNATNSLYSHVGKHMNLTELNDQPRAGIPISTPEFPACGDDRWLEPSARKQAPHTPQDYSGEAGETKLQTKRLAVHFIDLSSLYLRLKRGAGRAVKAHLADSQRSAVYLTTNPVQHQRTKHIEIDIHFVRDYVASGQVRVLHIPSRFQYADIFTKGLPSALFCDFRSSLNVRRSPVLTAGEY